MADLDVAKRRKLFGFEVDGLTMEQAASTILSWLEDPVPRHWTERSATYPVDSSQSPSSGCRYVVTPNVDHAVMLQSSNPLLEAYRSASLVLADGFPLIVASRLLGQPLPERVAGSELVPHLFTAAQKRTQGTRVYLLGAMPGVADRAAVRIEAEWPHMDVVGTYSPPLGFENNSDENQRIIKKIAEAQPELLLVGVGAPKQEVWVHRFQPVLKAKVALCIGATIDFLAGEKKQAPIWMRRSGLEWLHRVASEPRRLAKRYARDAVIFPAMLFREWQAGR